MRRIRILLLAILVAGVLVLQAVAGTAATSNLIGPWDVPTPSTSWVPRTDLAAGDPPREPPRPGAWEAQDSGILRQTIGLGAFEGQIRAAQYVDVMFTATGWHGGSGVPGSSCDVLFQVQTPFGSDSRNFDITRVDDSEGGTLRAVNGGAVFSSIEVILSSNITATASTCDPIIYNIQVTLDFGPPVVTTTTSTTTTVPPTTTTVPPTTTTTVAPTTTTTVAPTTTTTLASPSDELMAPSPITAGETITLSGEGFDPFEAVQAILFSDPIVLGEGNADEAGFASLTVTVPADTPPGDHTLQLVGLSSGRSLEAPVQVLAAQATTTTTSAEELPETGLSSGPLAVVGAGLLVFGIAAVALTGRRRET